MWTTQHTATTDAPRAAVWAALRAQLAGRALGPGTDRFELHGPLAVGTDLSVTTQEGQTFAAQVVELVEGEVYADRALFDGLELTFRHVLRPTGAGTEVTYALAIDGPGADRAGPELGAQIAADFPVAVQALIAAALDGVS